MLHRQGQGLTGLTGVAREAGGAGAGVAGSPQGAALPSVQTGAGGAGRTLLGWWHETTVRHG